LFAPRGLDHIVHAVHDLDAAIALYHRLGFTVGARNRHPWGTHNAIVQLRGFFVELLTLAEPEKIPPHAARAFSFGAFNRDFLARGEGLSMLVLEGHDAPRDAQAFRAAGIGDFEVFDFSREGRRPDGAPVKLAFSLAFARDRLAPEVGFFTSQQHYPENFWSDALQAHANTASQIGAAVLVAEHPADHYIFLEAFTGQRDLHSSSTGIAADTPRGSVEIMNPHAFRLHYQVDPPAIDGGMRLAAIQFKMRSMSAVEDVLRKNSIPAGPVVGRLVVGPQVAMGATIAFEAE
jgi:hypothetical protein